MGSRSYAKLAWVAGMHLVIMYLLVFAPVNAVEDIRLFNMRNVYKALIMVSPMIILMVAFMRSMYADKRINAILYGASAAIFVLSFIFIRTQAFVDNEQFIKSMIPHHSSAITMCQEARITDGELARLCDEIIRGQQDEIDQMNRILARLNHDE